MSESIIGITSIDRPPLGYLRSIGEVFAVFDARTQDSGNISYGVQVGSERYFVKTAGLPDDPKPALTHAERVELLRNAVRLRVGCNHHTLPILHNVIESPSGPMLVYEWLQGELIGAARSERDNPESAYNRFRHLPVDDIVNALDDVYDCHREFAEAGWVAVDFYDGAMLYDFDHGRMRLVDLDHYHLGPLINTMGRMFGSTRFMAPEEFLRGETIDQRTTVFTLARAAFVFLADGTLDRAAFRGDDRMYEVVRRTCAADREQRFDSVGAFVDAWREAKT